MNRLFNAIFKNMIITDTQFTNSILVLVCHEYRNNNLTRFNPYLECVITRGI